MRRLLLSMAGLLALGGALWHLSDGPAPTPPARTAQGAPLPQAAPAASGQPAEATAAWPVAATAAPTPAPAPGVRTLAGPVPGTVGSEGYGPHIEQAAAGRDPAAAWEALQWLRACDAQGPQRDSAEVLRNHGVAPEFMTQRMAELDAVARRCQTVTAVHRALVPPLAAIALRGDVPGAAAVYVGTTSPRSLTPEEQRRAVEALRRDAQNGHMPSVRAAAAAPADWGLSEEEQLRYVLASALQQHLSVDRDTARARARQAGLAHQPRLTEAELAAGLQSARELLQRAGLPVEP